MKVNFKNMVRLMPSSPNKVVLEGIIATIEDFRDEKITKDELLTFLCLKNEI